MSRRNKGKQPQRRTVGKPEVNEFEADFKIKHNHDQEDIIVPVDESLPEGSLTTEQLTSNCTSAD